MYVNGILYRYARHRIHWILEITIPVVTQVPYTKVAGCCLCLIVKPCWTFRHARLNFNRFFGQLRAETFLIKSRCISLLTDTTNVFQSVPLFCLFDQLLLVSSSKYVYWFANRHSPSLCQFTSLLFFCKHQFNCSSPFVTLGWPHFRPMHVQFR